MSCSNCFNECAEIVSDKCVRYTGIPIPEFNINTGDTLYSVESSITTYLKTVLTGEGIIITIPDGTLCDLVRLYLPIAGTPYTSVDVFVALIKSVCSLQSGLTDVADKVELLNGPYDIGCLTGVTVDTDTHGILQAVITKLCLINVGLTALALDLSTNYVKLADLNSLIAAYLAGQTTSSQQYVKMIPYSAVEYYGSLTYFDATGKGLEIEGWDKVYLCNGLNGTPDKRGRVPVGAIQAVPGGALSSVVNPSIAGNPNYAVGTTTGTNTVSLNLTQLPAHTHTATVVVTENPHSHTLYGATANWDAGSPDGKLIDPANKSGTAVTNPTTTGVTVNVTNASSGGGLAHANIQPVIACYYIMYIP